MRRPARVLPAPAGGRARIAAWGLLAAVLAIVALTSGASPAAAHAELLSTDPADGAVLPAAPATYTLTFNEPVRLPSTAVRLVGPSGEELPATASVSDARVTAELPGDLADGSYVVSWRVISADGHPLTGGSTFAVGAPSGAPAAAALPSSATDPAVSAVTVVLQALAHLGLFAAAGLVATELLVLTAAARRAGVAARRRRALAVAGGAVGAVATLALVPLTTARDEGAGLSAVLRAESWTSPLARDAVLTAVLVGAGVVMLAAAVRERRSIALAGAGIVLGSLALVGHTRTRGPAWLVLPADLLHVTTAALWFGGLIAIATLLAASRRDDAGSVATEAMGSGTGGIGGIGGTAVDPPRGTGGLATAPAPVSTTPETTGTAEPLAAVDAAAVVARFSALAASLLIGVSVTGVLLAWRILGSWSALTGTGFGQALLVKVALVAAVVGLAGVNRYRLLPRIRRRQDGATAWTALRRSVLLEAAVLVVVLAVTAVLVGRSPVEAETAAPAATAAPQAVSREAPLGTGTVTARVTPGGRGINALRLELRDAAGAPLTPVSDPEVSIALPAAELGPIDRPVSRAGAGAYETTADFPLAGSWIVEVGVRTSQFENPIVRIPVEVP